MTVFLLILGALLALVVAGGCAGLETGFLSVRRGRVVHLVREGAVRAQVVYAAISEMGRTTTALLVGNNLASVAYSSASAALVAALGIADSPWAALVSLAQALTLLFFGEFLPKLLFSTRPLRSVLRLVPAWRLFAAVFVPVGALVQKVIELIMPRRERETVVTPQAVLKILADRKDGVKLSELERVLIGRILSLRERGEFITPDSILSAIDETVC